MVAKSLTARHLWGKLAGIGLPQPRREVTRCRLGQGLTRPGVWGYRFGMDDDSRHPEDPEGAEKLGKSARQRLLEAVDPALALPDSPAPPIPPITGRVSAVQRAILTDENMARNVVWLAFTGMKEDEIVARTGYPEKVISTYLVSAPYRTLREQMHDMMMAKVNDALRDRLQEVVLEAVEVKIRLMRTASSAYLRNKAASDLIELGREAIALGRGNVSDLLKAVHEQAVKEKEDGTRITTERVTLEGAPSVVAAALRGGNGSHGASGDRTPTPPDHRSGESGPGVGAAETPAAPGVPGGDETDGHGGFQP